VVELTVRKVKSLVTVILTMIIAQSILGMFTILFLAFLSSEAKSAIKFKIIIIACGIHLGLALILLKIPVFKELFLMLNQWVLMLEQATTAGTSLVFGYLGGGLPPFETNRPELMFILAFKALPIILVISALSYLLYYYKILPSVVKFFSYLLQKTLHINGAVGLSVAANAFVGMVESPLLIKPYLKEMTRGEIFSVMVAGLSTLAGTVMVLYANILSAKIPGVMGHILTASLLNVVSSLIISMLMVPHQAETLREQVELPQFSYSAMDAIVKGTSDGVHLLINIIAMLIVLVALVSLANQILSELPLIANQPVTLQRIFGILLAPLTFLMGIPTQEMMTAGSLMGTKIVLNELIAYLELANLPPPQMLQEHSRIIMTYAMCGFANIGSLGIMIGGMTAMAPEKRDEIISLGVKSIFGGVLATCFTATIVGIILKI